MLNVIISEMEFNINSDKKKKLIVKNVFKVFGDEPKSFKDVK